MPEANVLTSAECGKAAKSSLKSLAAWPAAWAVSSSVCMPGHCKRPAILPDQKKLSQSDHFGRLLAGGMTPELAASSSHCMALTVLGLSPACQRSSVASQVLTPQPSNQAPNIQYRMEP